jgi:hypothetical protein
MSAALRLVGLVDVLSSTPAEPSRRAPCSHARLRRLATKPDEKCWLEFFQCTRPLMGLLFGFRFREFIPLLNPPDQSFLFTSNRLSFIMGELAPAFSS